MSGIHNILMQMFSFGLYWCQFTCGTCLTMLFRFFFIILETIQDVLIVPVAINYEKILDGNYVTEQMVTIHTHTYVGIALRYIEFSILSVNNLQLLAAFRDYKFMWLWRIDISSVEVKKHLNKS